MAKRALRVVVVGPDAAKRRRILRALLGTDGPCPDEPCLDDLDTDEPGRALQVCEADDVRELIPRPTGAFDAAVLVVPPGANVVEHVRAAAARLPGVPLVAVGGEPCADERALVASGVDDHVPRRCAGCASSPRLAAAVRWAVERRELLESCRRLRDECERRALHDPLTGLANRDLLRDRLDNALHRHGRDGRSLALLFVDLDGFKPINDALGHAAGDALLVAIARRLGEHVRAGDTCARWGGDEFVLLLENVSSARAAIHVARKLLAAVAEPVDVGGSALRVGASIGVALGPRDGGEADSLLARADKAMYAAKAAGGGRARLARDDGAAVQ